MGGGWGGGILGECGGELLIAFVGRVGAALFGLMILAVSLVLSTPLSIRAIGDCVVGGVRGLGRLLVRGVALIFPEPDGADAEIPGGEKPQKRRRRKPENDD